MKVLIIGGTGTISSSITRQLLERGDEVTLYNRGLRPVTFPGEWKHLKGDRTDLKRFEAGMREAGSFDCVIDMFCFSPDKAESDTRAFGGRTGQLIFCSTVDVYSKPASRYPITEEESRNGQYPYSVNKRRCEDILLAAHERGTLPVTIIRPAHTYCDRGRILFSLGGSMAQLSRIRRGLPFVVHGDGTSLWTSCHADDVARAFVNAVGNATAFGKAYHAAGEEWLTWNRIYRTAAEVIGAPPPRTVHIPSDALAKLAPDLSRGAVQNFSGNNIFDNTAAKRDLGFRYTIPWKEGFRRMSEWLDRNEDLEDEAVDRVESRIIAAWEEQLGRTVEAMRGDPRLSG